MRSVVCIVAGAGVGAVFRWLLGLAFNGAHPLIPMGTLLANLGGGYLAGVMLGVVAFCPQFSTEARLFLITGFLGALTTFSAFSGEVVTLLMQRHIAAALLTVAVHVAGSLIMTALGVGTWMLIMQTGK